MLINLRNALMTEKRLPYDAEVEYLRVDAVGPYIVIDGVTYCNAVGTYYAFTISSGGVVTHDLIPVRLGNTGYMYDRITNKRFGNAGTGDFVCGPDVVPVEYIESHGTEWIDTGVDYYADFEILCQGHPSTYSYNRLLGTSSSRSVRATSSSNNCWVFYPGTVTSTAACGGTHLISWRDGIISVDGTVVATNPKDSGSGDFLLFATATTTLGRVKIFSCKLYDENGVLIRSFLPVRVGTEGAMIDVLTRRIYRNAGTGAFGYGNDLKYPIPSE